jgi:hypothetical protein
MRDVTAAPPAMTEAPPWEDEKAVRAWAIATLRSEERVEIDAARQGPHKWNEDWARWQKRAFELAEEGDFDALIQFVAFSPNLGSITFEQRKILTYVVAGKIRRRKAQPRKLPPLYVPPEDIEFDLLVGRVDRVRSLLRKHYGQKKGVLARAVSIAGVERRMRDKVRDHFNRHGGNC